MIFNIFNKGTVLNPTQVFECAFAQSQKEFPNRFEEDSETVEQRRLKFEAISIFMSLYTWYLKEEGSKKAKQLSQDAYDYMFDRFEIALREQGVSDVRIGPEVKKLASAYTGRMLSYADAFKDGDSKALLESLIKNQVCDDSKAKLLSIKLVTEAQKMLGQTLEEWYQNLDNLKKGTYEPKELV